MTVDLPLIDVGAWNRISSANRNAEAAAARKDLTWIETQKAIVRGYAQTVATRAIVDASIRQLAVLQASLTNVRARRAADLATELEVARANAAVQRGKQTLASAEYNAKLQARALETLSGLAPSEGTPTFEDDLKEEQALSLYKKGIVPAVRAPELERDAAAASEQERRWALAPTLNATATERLTNATGFAGQSASFSAQLNLVWRLDAATFAQGASAGHQSDALHARAERARKSWEDDLSNTYDLVQASIATLRSSRAELEANRVALSVARAKYQAGTLLQLDLLEAERAAFAAEVNVLQAEADVFAARAHLRLNANMTLAPSFQGTPSAPSSTRIRGEQ